MSAKNARREAMSPVERIRDLEDRVEAIERATTKPPFSGLAAAQAGQGPVALQPAHGTK